MAGPAASVILPKETEWSVLNELLVSLGIEEVREGRLGGSAMFTITVPAFESYDGAQGPPCLDLAFQVLSEDNDWGLRSREEFVALERALSWLPRSEVTVAAWLNRAIDHHALVWICTEIAERLSGRIDVGGCLNLPEALRREQMTLGRLARVPFEIGDGRVGFTEVIAPEFAREWRSHPQFRMVK